MRNAAIPLAASRRQPPLPDASKAGAVPLPQTGADMMATDSLRPLIDAIAAARPELADHLIAVKVKDLWREITKGLLVSSRRAYDEGTVEMCQVKVGSTWGLYAIPRKVRAERYEFQKLGRLMTAATAFF